MNPIKKNFFSFLFRELAMQVSSGKIDDSALSFYRRALSKEEQVYFDTMVKYVKASLILESSEESQAAFFNSLSDSLQVTFSLPIKTISRL